MATLTSSSLDMGAVDATAAMGSSSSGGGGGVTSSTSILSDKVSRALQVRTDTPAMKAALDALQQLQLQQQYSISSNSNSSKDAHALSSLSSSSFHGKGATSATSSTSGMMVVDSRSVRQAMEYDALQQALALQLALEGLVEHLQSLKRGVSAVAQTASAVRAATAMAVVTTETSHSMLHIPTSSSHTTSTAAAETTMTTISGEENDDDGTATATNTTTTTTKGGDSVAVVQHQEEEQKLAAALADAFWHRNVARQRVQAVSEFLDMFDLSPEDSRLLDWYAFEDVGAATATGNNGGADLAAAAMPANGIAFLKALDRVRHIRQALSKSFGSAGLGKHTNDMDASGGGMLSERGARSSGAQTVGFGAGSALRMMEGLAQKQERAYERLYHWLQKYLHLYPSASQQQQQQSSTTSSDSNAAAADGGNLLARAAEDDEILLQSEFVKRCLYTLKAVPAFYSHCLELMASSRRHETTRRFLLALTTGVQPLEMKAHDVVTYTGDLLAYSFQAFMGEVDVFTALCHYVPPQQPAESSSTESNNNNNNNKKDDEENDAGKEQDDDDAEESEDEDEDGLMSGTDYFLGSGSGSSSSLTAVDMLAVSMSGLARPLKSRILHVVSMLARRDEDDDENNNNNNNNNRSMDEESDDGMLATDDFEEEGTVLRNRVAKLYEICGLLLFYWTALEKGLAKVQEEQELYQQNEDEANAKDGSSSNNKRKKKKNKKRADELTRKDAATNPLVACLQECLIEATHGYEATIRVYAAMLGQLCVMTANTTQAGLVQLMLQTVSRVRMSSPGYSKEAPASTNSSISAEWNRILSMEWVTETLIGAAVSKCETLDDTLALQQAVASAKKAGLSVTVAQRLDESIEEQQQKLIEDLVHVETKKVLESCGLASVATAFENWKLVQQQQQQQQMGGSSTSTTTTMLMATYPGLSAAHMEAALQEFYASLYSPPLPSLEVAVTDPAQRKQARSRIAQAVCRLYAELYEALSNPATGGYPPREVANWLGHAPEQVSTLFAA